MSERTPLLLSVPKDSPTRKERLEAFKAKHGIWTHCAAIAREEEPWTAMLVSEARKSLAGYGYQILTALPIELISGYCRLLDERDLLVTGFTERSAIRTLCDRNRITIEQPL